MDVVNDTIFNTWSKPLQKLLYSEYFSRLVKFINKAYEDNIIFPAKKNIFKAFRATDYKNLKVVILGKDPYPDGKATGIAFGNDNSIIGDNKISPSLLKIKECIEHNIYNGLNLDFDQTLESWSGQGVLLLNTSLTVKKNEIGSHHKYWAKFVVETLKMINDNNSGIIFMLWGKDAQVYEEYISLSKHYVLKFNHPSWAARKDILWDCDHFKKANELIEKNNGKEFCIKW